MLLPYYFTTCTSFFETEAFYSHELSRVKSTYCILKSSYLMKTRSSIHICMNISKRLLDYINYMKHALTINFLSTTNNQKSINSSISRFCSIYRPFLTILIWNSIEFPGSLNNLRGRFIAKVCVEMTSSLASLLPTFGIVIGIVLLTTYLCYDMFFGTRDEVNRNYRDSGEDTTEKTNAWKTLTMTTKKDFDVPLFYHHRGLLSDTENAAATVKQMNLSENKCSLTLSLKKEDLQGMSICNDDNINVHDVDVPTQKLLETLSKISVIFLVFQVKSSEEMDRIKLLLEKMQLTDYVPLHRVLFCCTNIGKSAIVRQILPVVHVEFDSSISEALAPHIRTVIQIGQNASGSSADGKTVWKTVACWDHLLNTSLTP